MATLNVRMTDDEYNKIKKDAEKVGLDVTSYIKFITTTVKIKVTAKDEIKPETKVKIQNRINMLRGKNNV